MYGSHPIRSLITIKKAFISKNIKNTETTATKTEYIAFTTLTINVPISNPITNKMTIPKTITAIVCNIFVY